MHEMNFLHPNNNYFVEKTKYTWNRDWIWPYESPWGIIEKFKLANSAQDKDILELLGTDNVRNKTKKFYTFRERDLISLEGLDGEKLIEILGFNIKEIYRNNRDAIIGAMPKFDNNDLYFDKYLKVCPECIKFGYHSIFHQLTFISECPFHGSKLINECPDCKRIIVYQLNDRYTSSPFVCLCGYSYINMSMFREYIRAWYQMHGIKIVTEKINHWLDINKDHIGKLNHSFFFKSIAKHRFNSMIDYCMSILDTTYHIENIKHVIITFKIAPPFYFSEKKKVRQSIENFQAESYKAYITIFRSIARHIRRKYLKMHRSCIKSLISRPYLENATDIPVCPYAYAYIMWRKEIEGYRKFSDVQNKVKPKLNYKETKIGRHIICFSDELQELLYEWIKYPKTDAFSLDDTFKWIIGRSIGFLLYHRFINYLQTAESHIKAGVLDVDADIINRRIPYFIFMYPNEHDKSCKMHYWLHENEDMQTISAYQVCPMKTKGTIRRDKQNQAFQYYKYNIEFGSE